MTIMPHAPDGNSTIPETALVGLVGRLNRTTRRAWADRGLLRKAARGEGYGERDAAELAAFFELHKELGDFYEAVAAWKGVRPRLNAAMSKDRGKMSKDRLIAIFDPEAQMGSLVTSEDEIGPLVMTGPQREHVFRAIDLSDRVRTAREAFWRAVDARSLRPPE